MKHITLELIHEFENHLICEEKSKNTIAKYVRDVTAFMKWTNKETISKLLVLEYKKYLLQHYAPASVNSALSSLGSFFDYHKWYDCKVQMLRIQKKVFLSQKKELTKPEYERLLTAAKQKKNQSLYYLIQTICSTGIRVSEHPFITVEAVKDRQAVINCKHKMRVVILPKQLCKILTRYIRSQGIKSGSIFVTRNGKPLDRSNIWHNMKSLCTAARVDQSKVFPHNLRHLFARTYYTIHKDIARLADILGHSSVNTTRIYTMETGNIHRQQIQRLGLLRC